MKGLSIYCLSQVGFNNGDGMRYYQHPWSRTANIQYIYGRSNVGITGRLVYRVDGSETGT